MKNLLFISLSFITVIVIYAFNKPNVDFKVDKEGGIQFQKGTWEESLQQAKKENKLIFLDIYATWCGPCKKLKANTFSNEEVGIFYNTTFINVALDGENGEGIDLARRYGVRGYPTLLFIDAHGKVVSGTSGYHNPSEFLALGKSIKKQ